MRLRFAPLSVVAFAALDTVESVKRNFKTPAGMPIDHPSGDTMREACRVGLGTSDRY
jgi:hypothetical protein